MSWAEWYIDPWGNWATRLVEGEQPSRWHYVTATDAHTGEQVRHRIYDPDVTKPAQTPHAAPHSSTTPASTGTTASHRAALQKARQRRKRRLRRQEIRLEDRILKLRHAYAVARADDHLLQRNIMRRLRQSERALARTQDTLTRLSKRARRNKVYEPNKPHPGWPVQVDVEISTDGVSYGNLVSVKKGSRVWVKATVTVNIQPWKPGAITVPHLMRMHWRMPNTRWHSYWRGHWDHDEYLVSNPLILIRQFKAPAAGLVGGTFLVKAWTYDYDSKVHPHAHEEGTQ